MLVRELEEALFDSFPRSWAEPWDKVGLSVGDPKAEVRRIALALNASADNVRQAHAAGANVLLTHHPVCLSMPDRLVAAQSGADFAQACIWESVRLGVSILSFHTNLDRSPQALRAMSHRLGLEPVALGLETDRVQALGRLGSTAVLSCPTSLLDFAQRCKASFGAVAQVYGDFDAPVGRVAFFTGSLGDCGRYALAAGCDVVVCGECGYHRALDLVAQGCAVVVLGHDASEFCLVGVLDTELEALCVAQEARVVLCEDSAWRSL